MNEVEAATFATAADAQRMQSQFVAESENIRQNQQAVQLEKQRTLEIQAEVERQVVNKQKELFALERALASEREALARDRAACDHRMAQFLQEMDQRAASWHSQTEQEHQKRVALETQLLTVQAEKEALARQLHSATAPKHFHMDTDSKRGHFESDKQLPSNTNAAQLLRDTVAVIPSVGQAASNHVKQNVADELLRGTVAVTPSAYHNEQMNQMRRSGLPSSDAVAGTPPALVGGRNNCDDAVKYEIQNQVAPMVDMMQRIMKDIEQLQNNQRNDVHNDDATA